MVATKKPIVPKTAQLDRLVAYATRTKRTETIRTMAKSKSLVWNHLRIGTPMSRPPTKWSQNAEGWSEMLPARRYARPMTSVTTYVHQPPPETKSVTKNQPTTAEMTAMNGNRQRQRKIKAAARIRNSSERCANDQPWNAWF